MSVPEKDSVYRVSLMGRVLKWWSHRQHRESWRFTWDVGILIAGNGFMSLLFLVFHMLAGRKMSGEAYAEFVALMGLFNVLGVLASAMQLTMARYIAEQHEQSAAETWLLIVRRGLRGVTRWGGVALAVWCLGAPFLRAVLNAGTTTSLIMVGVIAFVFLYTPILGGALQGSRRFGWFVASGIGVALSRLLMGYPVFLLQGSVAIVLGVVAASYVVGLLISYGPLRGRQPASSMGSVPTSREIQRYFWGVLIGQGALYILIFADLILSPRLFEGATLAAYGKAATLSRIVFFLPMPIITAMFPRAVTSKNPKIIIAPLFATLALIIPAALFMTCFPAFTMQVMYGPTDPLASELVRLYVWAAIPLALISIIAPYLWARKEVWLTLWMIPVTVLYVCLLLFKPLAPNQVLLALFCAGTLALTLLLGLTFRILRNEAKSEVNKEGEVS